MKKLEKLTLKELGYKMPLISGMDQREIIGGGIDDNDCFFEALVCVGSWLGYNNQSYESWTSCYGLTYGYMELLHAVTEGVNSTVALDFLNQNFNSASYVDINNVSASGSGVTMGFLSSGSATHAVLIMSVDDESVTYYDPQQNAEYSSPISAFAGAFNIN